jgi:hypothetical protein
MMNLDFMETGTKLNVECRTGSSGAGSWEVQTIERKGIRLGALLARMLWLGMSMMETGRVSNPRLG